MSMDHRGIGMTSQRTRERLISRLQEEGIKDSKILEVMCTTPRHIFVDEALSSRAYEDTALPIGHSQTISQPYIVARMTEILFQNNSSLDRVLEIGTGSGYQTSVLAQLVKQVYSVERIEALLIQARKRFQELKLRNIRIKHSDGNTGWEDYAPFDGILVTAAPTQVPPALMQQLKIGGCLVIPVGDRGAQHLTLIIRTANGYEQDILEPVRFVSLLSGSE